MKIGIVGCGYIANYYATTLPNHPELELVGVTDINVKRASKFAKYYGAKHFNTLDDMLKDEEISIVLNCTNPHSHYEVSRAVLMANKNVYTEKPMGMDFDEASRLVEMAKERNLYIASAPSILLGEYAQGIMKALKDKEIGQPILAYAQLDDGAVHNMRYWTWLSRTGTEWPYENEFKVGSLLEHAGYTLSLLTAFFGPVKAVQAYTRCLVPNKIDKNRMDNLGPDYSEACMEFRSGVVARLTIGSVAPNNHSLMIVGDDGVISTDDLYWNVQQKVYIQKRISSQSKDRKDSHVYLTERKEYEFTRPEDFSFRSEDEVNVDWAKGVAELADSILHKRKCRLDMNHALHIMEIIDVLENANNFSGPQKIRTVFDPIQPADWIEDGNLLKSLTA